jgi:hypothetical protein
MNTFPKLSATETFSYDKNGNVYIKVSMSGLTEAEVLEVTDFHKDNYSNNFYYYLNTLKGYNGSGTVFYYDTDSCKYVLAKDSDYDNLAINESLDTYQTNETTTSLNETFDSEEGTIFMEQDYSSDGVYLRIYNSSFECKVRISGDNLLFGVNTENESHVTSIPVSTLTYNIDTDDYDYIVYGVSYSSDKFCITHNGHYYLIELETEISDMTNITIVNGESSYKSVNNIVIASAYSDEAFLSGLTKAIDDTITITLGSDSATLSKSLTTYLYAKEMITAQFKDYEIKSTQINNDNYNIQINLLEA